MAFPDEHVGYFTGILSNYPGNVIKNAEDQNGELSDARSLRESHPIGSGIWWVHYYRAGKRHREKVGRKSDAIGLTSRARPT